MNHYVALDLGAESGRVICGALSKGRLELEEVHRFATGSLAVGGTLRWDVIHFFEEIRIGLRRIAARGIVPASISTDSWGVDYVYLRTGEPLPSMPFHYRDTRTEGRLAEAFARVPAEQIFAETGIQFLAFNTLYQLLDDSQRRPETMTLAEQFLNIGDYFNYLLCGEARAEESMASTTQLYNPRLREWSRRLIEAFALPERLFPPVVASGTVLGPLLENLAMELGWPAVKVIATCSHDTGAAVAAVPAEGEDWAFLSSGTWSLLGVEKAQPVITEESRIFNFTNEQGLGGTTRLLKNIVGLWIVQECRRAWRKEGHNYSYEDLARLAAQAPPLRALIDPTWDEFARPDRMPEKVAEYCRRSGQAVPESPGAIVRCIYESLALLYRVTLERAEKLSGRKIARLHIVGGGSKSDFFNQLVANAIDLPVRVGPVEATAIGNLLIQALALGHLASHAELRQVVRASFPTKNYEPRERADWQMALAQFEKLSRNKP